MDASTSSVSPRPAQKDPATATESRWQTLRGDVLGAVTAAAISLPICVPAGLLAYAPLGPAYSAEGAIAGLIGAAAAGVAAFAARSSFIISSPRAGVAIIQAAFLAAILGQEPYSSRPELTFFAMAACLLLAGVLQTLFGLAGLGRLIKFTPQAVLAGFMNGICILVLIGAVKLLVRWPYPLPALMTELIFAGAVAAVMIVVPRFTSLLPGPVAGLIAGTALYHAIHAWFPDIYLGPTVGDAAVDLTAILVAAADPKLYGALAAVLPQILETAVVFAAVASLESLLIMRIARNAGPVPNDPGRFLMSQGVGNVAAALAGGIGSTAGPSQTLANYKLGGRTRLSGILSAAVLLAVGLFAPWIVTSAPIAALAAMLFVIGLGLSDPWSLGLVRRVLTSRSTGDRSTEWKNIAVIATVTAITVAGSVTAGLLTGIALSAAMFIINMSRPLVRGRYRGDNIFSHRVRPQRDVDILRQGGQRRVVLTLQGVMFFGNTDDLVDEIDELWAGSDTVVLDFRRVVGIDASAAGALQLALSKAASRKKTLLFCSIPPASAPLFTAFATGAELVHPDLDTALEYTEELALSAAGCSVHDEVPLAAIEILQGLSPDQLRSLEQLLVRVEYPAGTTLCRSGEPADHLWILSRGSVSIWLEGAAQPRQRIAALAHGTTVGEMSLLSGGVRMATVMADEDVAAFVLDRNTYDTILARHPDIATTLLANIAKETVRRLRNTSQLISDGA